MISHKVEERRCTPYASLFSIHLWIPRVLIVQRGKGHHNGTQTRLFVSLPERLPRPGEKGRQMYVQKERGPLLLDRNRNTFWMRETTYLFSIRTFVLLYYDYNNVRLRLTDLPLPLSLVLKAP
ncbi:hypothetical protein [Aneurinibacillus aneurinilyticus]|uniref:hypothetical protein n=1 Tax=Aneurinibacillus aneurinilyticus TaxID=1391 RepID=UPI00352317F7